MIYLASPYNDPSPYVREQRYLAAIQAVELHLLRKIWVFSPIVHCHNLKKFADLPTGHDFWLEYDFHILDKCDALHILAISGWERSLGVTAERTHAHQLGIPVFLVRMFDTHLDISRTGA